MGGEYWVFLILVWFWIGFLLAWRLKKSKIIERVSYGIPPPFHPNCRCVSIFDCNYYKHTGEQMDLPFWFHDSLKFCGVDRSWAEKEDYVL